MTLAADPTFYDPLADDLYGYALTFPDRAPVYLPLTVKPSVVGYTRYTELDQPPGSEASFVLGSGVRRVEPFVLSGSIHAAFLPIATEDALRLYLTALDEATRQATGVQRGASVSRPLHARGYMTAVPTSLLEWALTFTLYPTGPAWFTSDGRPTPF